jgi:hypothetical protein
MKEAFEGRDAVCTFTKARVFAGGEKTEDRRPVSRVMYYLEQTDMAKLQITFK